MVARLKTEVVQVRLTPASKEQLKTLAKESDMNISEYLRILIDREFSKLK
ncbi:plasmid mobilization protein [Geomonas diazotrophica]